MKTLVLIDSNAIIHRAYHALPKTMTTRNGEPTNAVYGFTTALIRVLKDLKPDYVAASFDLAGPTFRHEHFAEYKATRVEADQELYDQIPRVKELLSTMEIPIYEKEGYEADDCLGTIVAKISKSTRLGRPVSTGTSQGGGPSRGRKFQIPNIKKPNKANEASKANSLDIYIVSGDKDIFQLIDGNIKVYNLRRGLTDTQIVDQEVIKKDYHLNPKDFIDLKALAGDPSDNIPGVPGIGPKTATELIQKFDTLEKLYENINSDDQIKPRIKELLIKHKDQAFLSQKLATIHKDVPIDFDLPKAKWGEYDREKLRKFFEKLGFRSLLRRFGIIEGDDNRQSTDEQKKKDEQLRLL